MQEQMKDGQTDICGRVHQLYLWEKCVVSRDQPTPNCPQASSASGSGVWHHHHPQIHAARDSSLHWGLCVCCACLCAWERHVSVCVCVWPPRCENAAMTNDECYSRELVHSLQEAACRRHRVEDASIKLMNGRTVGGTVSGDSSDASTSLIFIFLKKKKKIWFKQQTCNLPGSWQNWLRSSLMGFGSCKEVKRNEKPLHFHQISSTICSQAIDKS